MHVIGNSSIAMNMMVSSLYSVYLQKPTLLYGESATGKTTLAALMHEMRDAQDTTKFINLSSTTKLTKIESLMDKKELVLFIHKITAWQSPVISYINQKLLEGKPWMIMSMVSGNYKDVAGFLKQYEFPVSEIQIIYVPSLRERKEDLMILAEHVIEITAQKYKISPKQFSKNARIFIENYPWYGNFEEFNNSIKNSLFNSKQQYITEEDLKKFIKVWPESKERAISDFDNYLKEIIRDFKYSNISENSHLYTTILEEADKVLIDFALKQSSNLKKACQLLGLSPNTFRKKYTKSANAK